MKTYWLITLLCTIIAQTYASNLEVSNYTEIFFTEQGPGDNNSVPLQARYKARGQWNEVTVPAGNEHYVNPPCPIEALEIYVNGEKIYQAPQGLYNKVRYNWLGYVKDPDIELQAE